MPFSNITLRLVLVSCLSTLFAGCVSSPTSTTAPTLAEPRYGHAAVADNEKIYVIGGANKGGLVTSILRFDFSSNTWSQVDSAYRASRHNAAVVFGDEVFVIGGNTGRAGPFLDDIQVLSLPLQ